MFELRLAFLILLCIPLVILCFMLISKLIDEAKKNKVSRRRTK